MAKFPRKVQARSSGGTLLLLVLVVSIMLSGLMLAAHITYRASRRTVEHELNYHGQAVNAAKAGLIDALSWYRRQTVQPVGTFAPAKDLSQSPPVNETDDPDIGLVREYQISTRDHIWGRYEVRARTSRDITGERNLAGQGRCWYLESKGYVFERLAADYTPADFYSYYELSDGVQKRKVGPGTYVTEATTPNGMLEERVDVGVVRVLAQATMGTELRRLSVIPPADGAICAGRGDLVTVGNRARINGGSGHGLVCPAGTGSFTIYSGAEVGGSPATGTAPPETYLLDMEDVFGVSSQELRSVSDIYTDDPSTLPDVMPEYGLVFIDSNVTWAETNPLRGTAIVYVNGDVTLDTNSSTYFSGILYVEGDYVQRAPSLVNGTVMVNGSVVVSGLGDYSEINFDPDVRSRVLSVSGQYRFSTPMYFVQ